MADLNMETIRYALKTAKESGFYEISLSEGDISFKATVAPYLHPSLGKNEKLKEFKPEVALEELEEGVDEITAPLVGYYQSLPGALEVGQMVHKGDIVAHIMALGLPNEVVSEIDGEVLDVLATDFEHLEYKQVIARVRVVS